jgi:SWI/SNF-related matrix-associated actin-dependent regulator 1 of chromatin subfamily A
MKLTTAPYTYQRGGADFLLIRHYAILADEMGLGKSLQAIIVACEANPAATLIVCPAYLKVNWKKEFLDHTDETNIYMAKTRKCLEKSALRSAKVVIINYEMVQYINFANFSLVVSDECQYLKNMTAKRTKAFHQKVREGKPDRLILLSGTPIKNRVAEFYSILRLCSNKFCYKHSFRVRGRVITQFTGLKDKEGLKKLLVNKYKRRLAKNVLDLPPTVDKNVLMSFANDKALAKDWQDFLTVGMSQHMMSRKAISALAKSKFTINYAKELLEAGEGPLVIFCDHVAPVQAMVSELSAKYRVKGITGAVPAMDRGEYGVQFQNGQLDVLVATYGSGSTGLTLTKSRNMILNSYPWVGADLDQALKRVHRISQKNRVTYHYILGSPVDEGILELVKKKQVTIAEAL